MIKKILIALAAVLVLAAISFFSFAPGYLDRSNNKVISQPTITPNPAYDELPFVADLHCDMLLWDRDFLGNTDGHVDLLRMLKSNIAFEAFTIVSKTPKGQNIEKNDSTTDQITPLTFAQLRPPSTWFSLKARGLNQCQDLHEFSKSSNGKFRVITNKRELSQFIEDRKSNRQLAAGMLGLEGAQVLEGRVANLDDFYAAGVRYIGLSHFYDNEWAGSAHGMNKGGLTPKGKLLVRKMDSLQITIDLAHASIQAIDEILALTQRPVLVSHTGVKGMCNNQRNLTDEHLLEIGRRNGLVGIGLWETAVCGTDAAATAKSIRYAVDKIGVDKVCLGSDYDGAVTAPFDITGFPLVMEALQTEGFNIAEIEKIMGGNIRDFMLRNLPE